MALSSFRSATSLTNEQIAYYAPAVMATEAHDSRSDKYAFIPTIQILKDLSKEGFYPVQVSQSRTRIADKRAFTKHQVRLRHEGLATPKVGDSIPEIVLVNSHDGSSGYQISSGFFRLICANGMVVGGATQDIKVRHSGSVSHDVIDGCTRVLDDLRIAQDRIGTFQGIQLDLAEQQVLANAAISLRWDAELAPVVAASVLRPRRALDLGNDLWTTFNRIQEALVKGGNRGRGTTGRRLITRPVEGVSEGIKLNKALWALADGMAQIKANLVDVRGLVAA